MNVKRKTIGVWLAGLTILLLTGALTVLAKGNLMSDAQSMSSLEGIWTTMIPVSEELASINSLVISSQGS
jgi:hypothetical protein